MVHLRLPDEPPRTLVEVARSLARVLPVPLVVHGRIDVALAAGAAGVHLGVRDLAPDDARRLAGDGIIIGKSVGSESEARQLGSADYVTIGPVFPIAEQRGAGTLGLDGFGRLAELVAVPVIAIGGISALTARDVLRAGATGVALISAIFGSADPEQATRTLRVAIET